ncbi:MAG: ABC transporter permease [Planctomycetota bacterium]|nr:ABC transporter permease [Planctomycetota bacterium]
MSPSGPNLSGRLPLKGNEVGLLLAILVVLVLTTILDSNHNYLADWQSSAKNIARQTSLLGIFALGAGVVIISGGIDLSSGSMIAFSGTICATIMVLLAPEKMEQAEPLGLWVVSAAIAGTLAVGLLVGSLHAWLITVVGLPPFVATLASLVGLRSLARAVCENVTQVVLGGKKTQIPIFDDSFRYLGTEWWVPGAIFLILAALIWLMLSRTVIGRHLYALGGNEAAARLSGIRTENVKWLAYCIGTITATIAGILYIGDQGTADPQTLGRGFELNAIAAAVVGGCSLQGGVGTVPGTILGALFLRVVIDGVAKVIKTGADVYEGLIVGIVVVVAVAFSKFREAAGRGQEAFPGLLGIVAVVALTSVAGVLVTLLAGLRAGQVSAVVALIVLGSVKVFGLRGIVGFMTLVWGKVLGSLRKNDSKK